MKSRLLAAFTMILGIALSASAFAQGRHDEKPHGMDKSKPAAESREGAKGPAIGGRHDEKPHGMTKPAAKKDATKAGDDKGGK
jgi:hypothetical protein